MKRFLIFALFFVCLSTPLLAEPLIISLSELRDTATHIVYATYRGPTDGVTDLWSAFAYHLEVIEVIKGNLGKGLQKVHLGSGHVTLRPGDKVIAFLTDDMSFSWYAAPRGFEADPKQDLWSLAGFYDWNAYIVSASDMTFPMLKGYFVDRTPLSYHYKGALCFFDPHRPGLAPSSYEIDIQTSEGKPARFQSNLPLHDFAKYAASRDFKAGLRTVLESSVTGRRMEIYGQEVAVDAVTGTMHCEFWIPEPALYTEAELHAFLADPKIYHPWYELTVHAPGDETWTIELGEHSGEIGGITGTKWGKMLPFASISDEPITFITGYGGTERLELRTAKDRNDKLGLPLTATDGAIIQNLMIAPMTAEVYRGDPDHLAYLGTATISLTAVHYARP